MSKQTFKFADSAEMQETWAKVERSVMWRLRWRKTIRIAVVCAMATIAFVAWLAIMEMSRP